MNQPNLEPIADLPVWIRHLGGSKLKQTSDGMLHLEYEGVPAHVYVKDGNTRVRGSFFLDFVEDADDAGAWVARQPQPESAVLEVCDTGDGEHCVRILFERSLRALLPNDPLFDEASEYADAWQTRQDIARRSGPRYDVQGDPRDQAPENAWLLLGSEASFPSRRELEEQRRLGEAGVFETLWTAPKHAQVGDLVLLYFIAPRKAVHFVARIASRPFFRTDIKINADHEVADAQWWCYLTPLLPISPIPHARLVEAAKGALVLRGRSGRYLRPEAIEELALADHGNRTEHQKIVKVPAGNPDLPDPATMTFDQWRDQASGALKLEADVTRHVVEPLLRLAGVDSADLRPERAIGRKRADIVVGRTNVHRIVVEVKLAVREPRGGTWTTSPDFQQIRHNADKLGLPGILIDANRIYLIDASASAPSMVIERSTATIADLEIIRSFCA